MDGWACLPAYTLLEIGAFHHEGRGRRRSFSTIVEGEGAYKRKAWRRPGLVIKHLGVCVCLRLLQ